MSAPSVRPLDDRAAIAAMQALGATSPQHACRENRLSAELRAGLPDFIDRGLIREGAPGTYYLYLAGSMPAGARLSGHFSGRRFALTVAIWLLIVLIPVLWFQFSGRLRH
ncbi:MAG: hypothetical protein ABI194_00990 [Gemmatimonadaceae bacterium]